MLNNIAAEPGLAFALDAPPDERKPTRAEGIQILPFNSHSQQPRHIIKDHSGQCYILTNSVGVKLIELFDGQRTLDEIQQAFNSRYKLSITREKIERFADLCDNNNLLIPGTWSEDTPDHPRYAPRKRMSGNLGVYKRLFAAESVLDWLVEHRGWWSNPLLALLALALCVAGLMFALLPGQNAGLSAPIKQMQLNASDFWLLLLPLIFLIELSTHELAHGLSCRVFGAKSGGFGFGLLWGVVPIFFTDTTDAYVIDNKYKRMLISAVGPLVDLAWLGAAALIVWFAPADTIISRMALAFTSFPLSMLLINLNPFLIRMDGYWIVADWLEQPNLRRTAFRYLISRVQRLMGTHVPDDLLSDARTKSWRWQTIYTVYGLVALVWTSTFVVSFLWSQVQSLIQVLTLAGLLR